MKGDYEEFHALKAAKNKPNSKPNKANQIQFQNPTPRQRDEKEGIKNECCFLEPYVGDRTVYWGTGPFSKAISRGENDLGQGEMVNFEKMLALGAKGRYYLGFGIRSLVWGGHYPPALKMVCCAHPTRN